jgi:hypothetical protein
MKQFRRLERKLPNLRTGAGTAKKRIGFWKRMKVTRCSCLGMLPPEGDCERVWFHHRCHQY